jgi:hypothetical protein
MRARFLENECLEFYFSSLNRSAPPRRQVLNSWRLSRPDNILGRPLRLQAVPGATNSPPISVALHVIGQRSRPFARGDSRFVRSLGCPIVTPGESLARSAILRWSEATVRPSRRVTGQEARLARGVPSCPILFFSLIGQPGSQASGHLGRSAATGLTPKHEKQRVERQAGP